VELSANQDTELLDLTEPSAQTEPSALS